jgi:regulator of sirC expression with transglutaminase-like and TPR domain
MSSQVSTEQSEALSDSQKLALIKLLADEDTAIYHTIRSKILSCGHQAAAWLRPHVLSSDPILRRRAQEIVQHLERQEADNRFLAFCLKQGDELDVEQGAWLLAQTQYPDINREAYQALFDSYGSELLERIDFNADAQAVLATVNQYLFVHLGFAGNKENFYDPDNSYLNRVVDRRLGNPLSLCLVYLLVCRRLHLPVAGIGMPGHFLCRFQSTTEELFIDPFDRGKMLSKADCIRHLHSTGHGFQEDFLGPVNSRRILLRICSNLHRIYADLQLPEETARLQRYMVALSK